MTQSTSESTAAAPLPSPKERRRLREAQSLSEEQVATAVGVTRATVRSWETGRSSPKGRRREAYARLIGSAEEPRPPERTTEPAERTGTPPPNTRPESAAPRETGPPTPSTVPRTPVRGTPQPSVEAPGSTPMSPTEPDTGTDAENSAEADPPEARETPEAPDAPDVTEVPEVPADVPRTADTADATDATDAADAAGISGISAEEAFDALYTHAAPGLVRQTYLLTGRRRLSRESVEHAFQLAWQRWPEVAVDRDPAGWVRAAAYEYAMSPWHQLRRAHRHPDAPPTEPKRRALFDALLDLPPSYRRTLLLYDGVGLDLPETAAETEASTPAAAGRLMTARAAVAERLPELADLSSPVEQSALLHDRLGALALAEHVPAPSPAGIVRSGSERKARLWTRAAIAFAALLVGVTALTLHTAPTHYEQPLAPAERVGGVPPRGGPQKLTPQDLKLQKALRGELAHGPERLVPQIR
ncbi:helix-turn-helix domain-containing protein [Streptomyces sp. NBC_00234]|uniref:helix-turn-helix domain-containing protein n=1 Tax=Streptomyces sp. NBC_00234 TaxID=2903638 RepID=UPI002E2A7B90|nr:helix-turn-helix domain-containing protein [Streptomyces sp. NBC_00234]